MSILSIAIIIFMVLETLNVITLYFFPGSKLANGIGVFKAWEKSKSDPETHLLIRYLVNWVAGTKLIFVALLFVILTTGGLETQLFTMVAMIVSISSFFWRLFPLIKRSDANDGISPKGYSTTLSWMIIGFMGIFSIALTLRLLGYFL